MPHAFKADPDHPAVAYLVRLHADLGGQIQANKAEAKRLAEAMHHVEAVIKLYDPDYSVRAISARRRVQGNPWFKRGTMFRHALDALRKGGTHDRARDYGRRYDCQWDYGRHHKATRRAGGGVAVLPRTQCRQDCPSDW